MLGRTSLLCRQCLTARLRPSPFLQPNFQTRSLKQKKPKKERTRPEDYPEHYKNVLFGPPLEVDSATSKIYLKALEGEQTKSSKKLKPHRKGTLYLKSIHGRAEFVSKVMSFYDKLAMQTRYRKTGEMRMIPKREFYLSRAYEILKGTGPKKTLEMGDQQVFVRSSRPSKPTWSRWVYSGYTLGDGPPPRPTFSDTSVPGTTIERNFKRFLEKYTAVEGSSFAEEWARETGTMSSHEQRKSNVDKSAVSEIAVPEHAVSEEAVDGVVTAMKQNEKSGLGNKLDKVSSPVETVQEEEIAEIWRPNQKDQDLRQSTFSHPSQTTLAQATKQLRSSWAPVSFYDLHLIKGLPEAIESVTLGHLNKKEIKPTDIQALAIPVITKLDMSGFEDAVPRASFRSFLIAAETGSGKTLAYLIPLINRLKREEEWALRNPTSHRSIFNTHRAASPRSLIIAPTSELAEQIYTILKRLSHEIKFTVCALLPKFDDSVVRKSILSKYIDVLVSTPHRLNDFIQSGELRPNMTRYLIIDEADTIFDRSFVESLAPILNTVEDKLTHLVLCTATIPLALEEKLHRRYPGMQRIVAPKIHTAPRRINFELVLEADKRQALLDTLKSMKSDNTEPTSDVKRAIVFCNVREGVREVYEFLKSAEDVAKSEGRESSFELIPFTRDNYDRHTALERFNERDETNSKKLRILITTDMGSRGLDTMAARTVVLYDVPYSSIDLLHRLGRTARAGTRGRAFMIVSKAEYRGKTKEWVNEIRDRLIRGEALV